MGEVSRYGNGDGNGDGNEWGKEDGNFHKIKRGKGQKIVGSLITVFVLALLLLAGPANAIGLSLGDFTGGQTVRVGETSSTIAKITINSNEFLDDVSQVKLEMDGPGPQNDRTCIFDLNGSLVSGCSGISIVLISNSTSFAYGYGFTNGDLEYNITVNTTSFSLGMYHTTLVVGNIISIEEQLVIAAQPAPQANQGNSGGGSSGGGSGAGNSNSNNNGGQFGGVVSNQVQSQFQQIENQEDGNGMVGANESNSGKTSSQTIKESKETQTSKGKKTFPGITGAVVDSLKTGKGFLAFVFVISLVFSAFITTFMIIYRKKMINSGRILSVRGKKGISDYNY